MLYSQYLSQTNFLLFLNSRYGWTELTNRTMRRVFGPSQSHAFFLTLSLPYCTEGWASFPGSGHFLVSSCRSSCFTFFSHSWSHSGFWLLTFSVALFLYICTFCRVFLTYRFLFLFSLSFFNQENILILINFLLVCVVSSVFPRFKFIHSCIHSNLNSLCCAISAHQNSELVFIHVVLLVANISHL